MIFPPAFLDSSSWNDNNNQQQHQQQQQQQQQQHAHAHGHHQHQVASGCGGGDGNSTGHELLQQQSIMAGGGTLADGGGGPAKPMSMSERARLARIPLPEPGLKCPRCDSTNTKFCYFNNYSLSQPRHFCRACRRYWTRGGALRNVPVGGGYRRHAKRAKPKTAASAAATAAAGSAPANTAGSMPAGSTTTTSSTCTTSNAPPPPPLPAMLGGNLSILPPLLRLADFDAMSLGSTFSGAIKPPVDCYSVGGAGAGMEQWRFQQMQSFPFFHHAMDQAAAMGAPAPTMAMPGMFQLGLDGGDGHGGGEDGGEFHHAIPSKREAAGYPRGMYGDHHLAGGYTSYSSATTGNHLL